MKSENSIWWINRTNVKDIYIVEIKFYQIVPIEHGECLKTPIRPSLLTFHTHDVTSNK